MYAASVHVSWKQYKYNVSNIQSHTKYY